MSLDFFARGLHARTAVARVPLRQLGFLVYCYNKKCMAHKSKITPATSPLFCNPLPGYLAKHTTANIDALFSNVKHLKVYPKQFSSSYSIIAYLFTAMLCNNTVTSYCAYA